MKNKKMESEDNEKQINVQGRLGSFLINLRNQFVPNLPP